MGVGSDRLSRRQHSAALRQHGAFVVPAARRLCVPGAWLVAAVFAVHPLHVESVAWIIERKDVLSALFYLTAVLGWIRFVEEPRRERYILVLALFCRLVC